MTTKQIGDISEAQVITQLLQAGVSVSVPFGDRDRYDLIVDTGKQLLKVQVKTALNKGDFILVKACSITTENGKYVTTTYHGQIDYVIAYEPTNSKLYMIHINEFGKGGTINLRVSPTKNKQLKRIISAENFEFNKVVLSLIG